MEIAFADPATTDVAALVALINEVYAEAEKGLWVEGSDRTTVAETGALVAAGEIVVARDRGELIGAVRVQRLPTGEGEFGMLAAAPARRGTGIGRELVAYAENWAREQGATTMQLELLVPHTWEHPFKEFLRGWYTRLGYRQVRTGDLAESYPQLRPLLATECDYLVFNKPL